MTECNHDYGHCYECDSQQKLVYQSRCVKCVIRRLEFNLVENAELRTENEALRHIADKLDALNGGTP